jgi:hypothetical protein
MDRGFASVAGQTAINGLHSSSQLNDELADDYSYFKTTQKCGSGSPPSEFGGNADEFSYPGSWVPPRYICSGTMGQGTTINTSAGSPYLATDSGRTILMKAWDYFFDGSVKSKGELTCRSLWWWMIDGKADVGNAPNQVYSYLGHRDPRAFECIRAFISFVVNYDTLPTAANHGTNWPTSSNGTTRCTLF